MGFEFTNKPPAIENASSAFKPLPSLPIAASTRLISGPTVTPWNNCTSSPRPAPIFGARPKSTSASDEEGSRDAFNLFLPSKKELKLGQVEINGGRKDAPEESHKSLRPCGCRNRPLKKAAKVFPDLPSIPAHTIKPTVNTSRKQPANESSTAKPFRFLDLPGEMRNRVYREALSPGYLSLRSCIHHFPTDVHPPPNTALLVASKQVAKEAEDIITESTFIVNAGLESGARAVINRHQVPDSLLPKIKHLVLVVDFTRIIAATARPVDWRQIQRMTGLESLRICGVQIPVPIMGTVQATLVEQQEFAVKDILDRIPKACTVAYGPDSDAERDHIEDMAKALASSSDMSETKGTPAAELEAAAKAVEKEIVRGSKHGNNIDYRFVD